ncbi:MAG: hypothetical protein J6W00_14945 [Lentisphaeria bacterium]|nr:hypothetical protein [Lentisphaeria bacterium]
MIDGDKLENSVFPVIVIFILGLMIGGFTGFSLGSGLEAQEQVKEQKKLLIEQNKLLKENIELYNELLKLKGVEK